VDARGRAGGVEDVAQTRRFLVIERISDMDMGEDISAFSQHRFCVVAEIEGMWRAVEEFDIFRVYGADDVDRRLERFAPVLGVRLDVQHDLLTLEDRDELFHPAPPGI